MAFGQSSQRREICFACRQEKAGSRIGKVGGVGFGNSAREGSIQVCINPDCPEGKRNLAEQDQKAI